MSKGIVFTLDAILSILIASVVIVGVISFMGKTSLNQDRSLAIDIADSTIGVLETSGLLAESLENFDTEDLGVEIDWLLPSSLCGKVTFYNETYGELLSKSLHCWESPAKKVVVYRGFMINKTPYLAKLEVSLDE